LVCTLHVLANHGGKKSEKQSTTREEPKCRTSGSNSNPNRHLFNYPPSSSSDSRYQWYSMILFVQNLKKRDLSSRHHNSTGITTTNKSKCNKRKKKKQRTTKNKTNEKRRGMILSHSFLSTSPLSMVLVVGNCDNVTNGCSCSNCSSCLLGAQ
jgi:hypothetical protein